MDQPRPRDGRAVDVESFRLRRFVERPIGMGEVEIREEPVALQ